MHAYKTEALERDAQALRLAFCCEECLHFDEDAGQCGIFFPTAPHRRARFEEAARGDRLYFCKMFEPI
jgi:hypothetical protein